MPCEASYPASPCSRVSCHTGFPRVQPVFCPALLPGIFATCRSARTAAAGRRERSKSCLVGSICPLPMTLWIEQAPDPRLPSTNRMWTTPWAPQFGLGQAGEAGWATHLCSPASSQNSRRWQRGYAVPTSPPRSNVPPRCMTVAGLASHAGRSRSYHPRLVSALSFGPVIRVWDERHG